MKTNMKELIGKMTLDEKISLLAGADFWHTAAVERLGIPAAMMCDGPNGLRKQDDKADHLGINQSIRAVCFPTSSAVAASFDRALAQEIGETLGAECQAEKVSMLLGPGVNIKRSPLCGRNFEYYSEDPYLSTEMAAAYIAGVQSKNVAACMKHFAANNQETRRMNGNSVVDERTLHEIYLASFEGAVKKAKPKSIMCAYNQINGSYGAENDLLNNEILRKTWGFDGFMVTDWGAIKNRVKGLGAGIDLEMPGSPSAQDNCRRVKEAVENSVVSEEELNTAVERLLNWIFWAAENRDDTAAFDYAADYQKAVKAAESCAVLLKNSGVLPLAKSQKIALIGAFAEKPRYQGSGSSHINSYSVPTLRELTKDCENIRYAKGFTLTDETADAELETEALTLAADCDAVVVLAGLPERFETEGVDRKHMHLPENQNRLIAKLTAQHKNVIVVLHNGSPVEMPWAEDVAAILEMYLGGDGVSEATLTLLYGDANPSGKLAETFPLRLEDNPSYLSFPGENGVSEYREGIFVGYRYYDKKKMDVRFPFGHGLSYTTFAYSDFALSADTLQEGDAVEVSFTLTNTGSRAGAEAVQLYICAEGGQVIRPLKELKGFEKVYLQPGESRRVAFVIDKKSLAYYEPRLHDWYAAGGSYAVLIGSSSRDIRLQGKLAYTTTTTIPMVYTRDSSLGDLAGNPKAAMIFSSVKYEGATSNDAAALGEAGNELAAAMMVEMPLGSLVSFGMMSDEQLDGLLAMLNG